MWNTLANTVVLSYTLSSKIRDKEKQFFAIKEQTLSEVAIGVVD